LAFFLCTSLTPASPMREPVAHPPAVLPASACIRTCITAAVVTSPTSYFVVCANPCTLNCQTKARYAPQKGAWGEGCTCGSSGAFPVCCDLVVGTSGGFVFLEGVGLCGAPLCSPGICLVKFYPLSGDASAECDT
jgi:hypothetical protein